MDRYQQKKTKQQFLNEGDSSDSEEEFSHGVTGSENDEIDLDHVNIPQEKKVREKEEIKEKSVSAKEVSEEKEENEEDEEISEQSSESEEFSDLEPYDLENLPFYACDYCGVHDKNCVARCTTCDK